MKTIEIEDGTYVLVMGMAKATGETSEYILYRSVTRVCTRGRIPYRGRLMKTNEEKHLFQKL